MAMTAGERRRAYLLAIMLLGVAGATGFWIYWRNPQLDRQQRLQAEIDSIQARVASAERDLQRGSIRTIQERNRDYEASLQRMRDLVPTGNEVTTLIDDISTRASRNGVEIGGFDPLPVEAGESFDVYRYRWSVFGNYDEIGVLMSDIGQLPRIMVPYDVSLRPASQADAQARGDTTGALIEATFLLRTFVKRQLPGREPGAGGGR